MCPTQADENYRAMSLSMAHAIQQALLPKECPKCAGANLAAKYRPVEHIGGDFYDFTHLGKEQIGLLIGDVIGHSIHSALIMALLLGLLRADRRERLHPAQIISDVNELLVELSNNTGEMFLCTLFYGVLDIPSRVLFYIDAGHPPPLCCRRKNITSLASNAMLLGAETFQAEEQCHQFEPGDRIVLYTDGIIETRNQKGDLYDIERLKKNLQDCSDLSASQTVEHVFTELDSFAADTGPEDDATVVVLDFD